jgi:transposase
MGGRKPKAIAGDHAGFPARRVREGAFPLRGPVAELAERGLKVDDRSVWNFVRAEKLSFKKTAAASERDRPGPTSDGRSGRDARAMSTLSAWRSSTRPGRAAQRLGAA